MIKHVLHDCQIFVFVIKTREGHLIVWRKKIVLTNPQQTIITFVYQFLDLSYSKFFAHSTLFDKSSAKNQDQLFPKANVHDSQVSCINLRSFFKITEPLPPKQELVTVNTPDGVFGLIVDKILGNRQIVIKPIGRLFQNCTGIGNTTILGDGSVAIVLDIFKLTDLIISDGKKRL